jgi:N-acetylmuramoyl-L-alanine amidase
MALWIEDLLIINKYSRPGIKLLGVEGIVMHWTATPGASDENEVAFFDGADGGGSRYAGAHIFIDDDSARLDIPLNEVAYHANEHACRIPKLAKTASYYPNGGANLCTIGIEMCVEKDGTIHKDTIARAVKIVAALCKQFKLDPLKDIYRHFDITGKNCPAPWVAKPSLFTDFKNNVKAELTPPVVKESTPAYIGTIEVLVDKLNVRAKADFDSTVVKVIKKEDKYKVYKAANGMYQLGNGQWTSAGSKYVKFTPVKKK